MRVPQEAPSKCASEVSPTHEQVNSFYYLFSERNSKKDCD